MPGADKTFREILRQLHASKTAEDLAILLTDTLAPLLGAQGAVLQLWPGLAGDPFLRRSWGWGESYQGKLAAAAEQLLDRASQTQVLILSQPGLAPYLGPPAPQAPDLATLVWLLLGGQEEWWGFLAWLFAAPPEIPVPVLDFLEDLGQQATCALAKIRLIVKQQQEFAWLAQQTERLTAVGRLAAGVAHELNNPLASILLFSSNLLKKVPQEGPLHEGLAVIIQETKRCKALIQDLLELARTKEPKKIVANLNTILSKVLNLLENEFRRRAVHLRQDLAPHLPDQLLDVGQMQQALVHLVLNALEAVEAKGEVHVASRWDQDRQAAIITIRDTGCGIPAQIRERLFEPFFSTKPRATGLGLTVSRGFIQDHGGDLQVDSEPGQGTWVTIILPRNLGPTTLPQDVV
jgi:two-component system NtrC family sensor kinase